MKVIKNLLDNEDFLKIEKMFFNKNFPWYLLDGILNSKSKDTQLVHMFVDKGKILSTYFENLYPIFKKLNINNLIRVKANLQLRTNNKNIGGFHIDYENVKTAVYYINTNNGMTIFKNGKKIKSEKNKIVVFDSNQKHSGTTCTDKQTRIVLNINYQDLTSS